MFRFVTLSKIRNCFTVLFLFIAFTMLMVAGCVKKQAAPEMVTEIEKNIAQDEVPTNTQFNKQLFASTNLTPDYGDYQLGPGDILEIRVLESEKLNATVRVSSRGLVSLPLVGEVEVKGLTAWDAEKLIEEKLKATYIKDPHVSIFVKEHFSQRVTIVGAVRNPGTYDFPGRQRLMDALALAGGLTERAGPTARIRRNGNSLQGTNNEFVVDLDELMKEGKTELNISINGGDVIFVPEAGAVFIDGAVLRPGKYLISQKMTLMEAILTAGGFASYADTDKVVLSRQTESGQRELLDLSLNEDDGKEAIANQQLMLKDRDIIVVDVSFWGRFRGLGLNLGPRGVGVTLRSPNR